MSVRILCCSDTHGNVPPRCDEAGAVAWLHGGDLVDGPNLLADGSNPFKDPLRAPTARWFAERSIPIFVAQGNHDTADDYLAFQHAQDVTGLALQIVPGLFVAGIGWHGQKYFELPFERDLVGACESVRRQILRKMSSKDKLILLTHYPPRFPELHEVENDRDGGGVWYNCIRELVEELSPLAVVQGHVHQWFRSAATMPLRDNPCLIVAPGPTGAIVEVDLELRTAKHCWIDS